MRRLYIGKELPLNRKDKNENRIYYIYLLVDHASLFSIAVIKGLSVELPNHFISSSYYLVPDTTHLILQFLKPWQLSRLYHIRLT